MSRLPSLTALALVVATPALAGGTAEPAPAPEIVPVPVADPGWGGFYGGLQLEYGLADIEAGGVGNDYDGALGGLFLGYRVDYGDVVFGTEFDLVTGELSSDTAAGTIDTIARSALELGYDMGNTLVYGTAGVVGAFASGGLPESDWGGFVGIGVDYRVGASGFISAELLQHRITDFASSGADVDVTTFGIGYGIQF